MDEVGIVKQVLPNGEILISVARSSACVGCGMQGLCFPEKQKSLEVTTKPKKEYKVGDKVRLQLDSSSFLKYSFITYMIPVLLIIIGAGTGTGLTGNELFSVAGAVIGLVVGLVFVRFYSKKLDKSEKIIVRVLDAE